MNSCLECGKKVHTYAIKYCSNKCQKEYQYKKYIEDWKKDAIVQATKNISKHIKRYLFEKYNSRCIICKWGKKHPVTNKIPLEVDHIDGDANNNSENNLKLLCPNCHSLTTNFRNLNKGKGRNWRNKKRF